MFKRARDSQLIRPARSRTRLLVLAAATALLASAATAATANTATATHPVGGPKPTIVLVHGAWADSSGWDAEITTLTGLGYTVVPIANPLRGLSSDSDYVRARLEQISGPIVLVGHSYGGAVITNAARGVPNATALVYVAAFAPAEGESLATILPADRYPDSHLDPSKLDVMPVPNPAAGT